MRLKEARGIILCFTTVLVLKCVLCNCPSPYLSHHHGDKTVCCLPAFNCGPNAEIIHCREDMGQDMCQKCSSGYINPNVVSSVDKKEHRCFEKESHHESCPLEDTIPTANLSDSSSCLLYCTCRNSDCYYGYEPCSCEGPQTPCKENETLDPDTGDCVPCPVNSYKLEPGCGPCTWNVTALLGDLAKKKEKALSTEKPTSISGQVIIVPYGPSYNISKPDNQTDTQTDHGKKDDSFSPAPVIAIVVVVLIIAIFAAVVLVTYRKVQSNDEHSRLVKCYHVLCPGRQLEAQAGQRDTESVTDPPYNPGSQNQGRPLQHVAPITRANGTVHENQDTYNDCNTIPYSDMSMSPERPQQRPPSLGTSLEEINEEEEQEPTSVSPLIENNENRDSVDPELTAQKTAASFKEY